MRRGLRRPGAGRIAVLLLGLACIPPGAGAQERLGARVDGQEIAIYLYRPPGPGPFPLAILSHGSPRDPERRGRMGPQTMRREAQAFVDEGAAAAVVIRRGYGGQGRWAEGFGSCEDPDYAAAGLAGAQDILAAREIASRQPGIDASRTVLVGRSAGGWSSVAAASRGDVTGVVSFAGGRGSRGPDDVCRRDRLVAAAAQFGRTSRAPELWIYSRNDRFFGPGLADRLASAFAGAGGRAELLLAEPYREDGHFYADAVEAWRPQVMRFLRRIGFLR